MAVRMRSEMEVPPNSLIAVKERGSPTTTTWGGGILGGVGGRRKSRLAMLTINKISFDEADYINAFSHSMLQREEVFLILTMSSRPAPCGSPAATSITSAMRGSSACLGVQTWVTRPWRSFETRHGGA